MSTKNIVIDPRTKWLTSRQKEILKIAQEKGFITEGIVRMFYSSKEHWTRALNKLIAFNILIPAKNSSTLYYYNKYQEVHIAQKTLKKITTKEEVDAILNSK